MCDRSLPSDAPDPYSLADWMEIGILSSDRSSISQADLISALRQASLPDCTDYDDIERLSLEVFNEIRHREKVDSYSYPFRYDREGLVRLSDQSNSRIPYLFSLVVSYCKHQPGDRGGALFEKVAKVAAKEYLAGDSVRFGWPREELPASFDDAVDQLCESLGEGKKFNRGISDKPTKKDDKVDIVAWKNFDDGRPSKVILFGQCATGEDWDTKVAVKARQFCNHWMEEGLVSPVPMQCFFCPHRVDFKSSIKTIKDVGVFFDRLRVSYWASRGSVEFNDHKEWYANKVS